MPHDLEVHFPNLQITQYKITSSKDCGYNCIAYSFEDDTRWWWPDPSYYWPSGIPMEETLEAFVRAYESIGYSVCENGKYEFGYKKVAIYTFPDGKPTHAARQLPSGKWTSKLGNLEDIEHELNGLFGNSYGTVATFLKIAYLSSPPLPSG